MNVSNLFSSCRRAFFSTSSVRHAVQQANPAIAGLGGKKLKGKRDNAKQVLEVETDAWKLASHVCGSNIMQTGEDVEIKPDSEYPDWLWSIHTGPAKKLEDLEPGTKEYLEKLKRMNIKKTMKIKSLSKIKN